MNQFKNVFALCLLVSFVMLSCAKDDDGDISTDPNVENYFACKIDGEAWESQSISQPTVTQSNSADDVAAKRLDFFGQDAGGQTLALVITDYRDGDVGECISTETFYGSEDSNYDNAFTITSSTGTVFTSEASLSLSGVGVARDGTITVTKCADGKISGTFSLKLRDINGGVVSEITDGVFTNVAYDFF